MSHIDMPRGHDQVGRQSDQWLFFALIPEKEFTSPPDSTAPVVINSKNVGQFPESVTVIASSTDFLLYSHLSPPGCFLFFALSPLPLA